MNCAELCSSNLTNEKQPRILIRDHTTNALSLPVKSTFHTFMLFNTENKATHSAR